MKIAITDDGSGIALKFARAISATIRGRFIDIPKSKGGGYLTGFSWGSDLRMMIRHYHLNDAVIIERTNELLDGQEDVVFQLSGILPSLRSTENQLSTEQATVLICKHALSASMDMPSHTAFGSVTIAVSKSYLRLLFGQIDHPVVASVLEAGDTFIVETGISASMLTVASAMLHPSIPESLESHYYRLKCEELLCYTFGLLMQREALPLSRMHLDDIKAIYTIKHQLQVHLSEPPHVAALAREAGMSEPKLRKLFKQTFGKGVFAYYQSARMQEAARLLTEKGLTVSEVGYQLGFSNLSHFSRVFEQHLGQKPKQYAKLGYS